MSNQFRILLLKIAASLAALMAGGCNMPSVTPQPVTPAKPQQVEVVVRVEDGKLTVNDATINVQNAAPDQPRAAGCDCGCGHSSLSDCEPGCPRRVSSRPNAPSNSAAVKAAPQLSEITRSKPVVEMLSDFDDGACSACDLAWSDWKANGSSWPFVLTKRRGAGGRTSPTFVMPSGKSWSPSSYSVGGLAEYWRAKK